MPDSGLHFLSSTGGCKVATPPPPKHRHYKRRFRKQLDLYSSAVAVFGNLGFLFAGLAGFLSAGLMGSLFASLAGSFESAAAAGFLSIAGLTAASAPDGNLVRNCIDFLQSWLTLSKY